MTPKDERKADGAGKNLWSNLLSEVSNRATASKFSVEKNIIIVGDDMVGKTTLATKLQGKEDSHRGSALEYQYLEVNDEDADEKAICGIWILEGHRAYRPLLHYALPKERLSDSIVIVAVDMSQPWSALESLDNWTTALREHVDQLKLKPDELKELEQRLVADYQTYVDPNEESDVSSQVKSEEDVSQLGNETLTCNLGIQIVVVCTKCDQIETLETDYDYKEEHLDFIQLRIRQFCLRYGAALFYTSVKDNKTMEILHKYVLHKLYRFPFKIPASIVDKDSIFVPAGWDTEKKISIISENLTNISTNDTYESIIKRPSVRKPLQDMKEVSAEDEQTFLAKALAMLQKPQTGAAGRASVPARSPALSTIADPTRGKAGVSRASYSPGAVAKPKPDAGKNVPSNEKMLATFFNSLLSKKTGSVGGSPGKTKITTEKAASDLSRLQQQAKSRPSQSSNSGSS